jgi:predicted AlkP superfamily pyrophosphatase or phosphodiesterase
VIRFFAIGMILVTLPACQNSGPDPSSGHQAEDAFWPIPAEGATPKVLLVGWDGVRPDVLREVPTPVFDTLASAGSFSENARTARPTVSGPCWSSILTGVWPEKHGVHSNDFSSNRYADYPDLFTHLESVKPGLNTYAAADWLPLVSDDAGGPLIAENIDRKIVLNGYELGWLEADSISVAMTLEELQTGDPDVLFVYIGAPDEISHTIGGIGREYTESIATADRLLGQLLEGIRGRSSFLQEDWLVLVVTDHGRTETGGHGGESPEETTIFYLASGPSAEVGTPPGSPATVDLVTTAFAHLGVPIDPAWELDGQVVGLKR